jgi:dihydroneopterin aldolase
MAQIRIVDLEVFYNVGVPDEERAQPQRLLICVEMEVDFSAAAASDRLNHTIDYYSVCQELLNYGKGRSWRLIEKTAANLADFIMVRFKPRGVTIEVKKFIIPQAKYVSVVWSKP